MEQAKRHETPRGEREGRGGVHDERAGIDDREDLRRDDLDHEGGELQREAGAQRDLRGGPAPTPPGARQVAREQGLEDPHAPEVARDDMREQIRKKIKNEDLFEGCRNAFKNNYESVKLFFLCVRPGKRES